MIDGDLVHNTILIDWATLAALGKLADRQNLYMPNKPFDKLD